MNKTIIVTNVIKEGHTITYESVVLPISEIECIFTRDRKTYGRREYKDSPLRTVSKEDYIRTKSGKEFKVVLTETQYGHLMTLLGEVVEL